MRKLDLPSEDEVEIRCRGEPVIPTLQLYKLIELWLQTISTSEKICATIGSSAEEFVMVLADLHLHEPIYSILYSLNLRNILMYTSIPVTLF
ncbi:E3 ubiquitin protein ligase DRIP2-like [Apium graveolens]|uniref:E3 ubiquitin protein ligase DRIP2-like n=1 Tax=Apium graveolens TaxID=4045 RepID=UPI003D78BB42